MLSPLMGVAFVNAVLFGGYSECKRQINRYNGRDDQAQLTIPEIALAGSIAGFAGSFVCSPVEFVKTQMQVQVGEGGRFKGSLDCAQYIMKQPGGLRTILSQGLLATLVRETPGNAAYYATYEIAKRGLAQSRGADVPMWMLMASGSVAGIAFWVTCYPMDMVKSRIQSQPFDKPKIYSGVIDCARKIVQQEGVLALWRGFGPCITRTIPAGAATFTAFEIATNMLQKL